MNKTRLQKWQPGESKLTKLKVCEFNSKHGDVAVYEQEALFPFMHLSVSNQDAIIEESADIGNKAILKMINNKKAD